MAVAPDSSCQVVQPGLRALHRDWWVISNTKSVIFWDHLREEQSLNTIQHKKFIISSKGLFERLMHDLQNTKKWALRALLLNFSTFVVFFFKEIHFPWKHRSQLSKHIIWLLVGAPVFPHLKGPLHGDGKVVFSAWVPALADEHLVADTTRLPGLLGVQLSTNHLRWNVSGFLWPGDEEKTGNWKLFNA